MQHRKIDLFKMGVLVLLGTLLLSWEASALSDSDIEELLTNNKAKMYANQLAVVVHNHYFCVDAVKHMFADADADAKAAAKSKCFAITETQFDNVAKQFPGGFALYEAFMRKILREQLESAQ